MAEKTLDTKGLQCPMPIIKLSKFVKAEMQKGDVVRMESTDKACTTDVEAWCEKTKNKLLERTEEEGVAILFIEKSVD